MNDLGLALWYFAGTGVGAALAAAFFVWYEGRD